MRKTVLPVTSDMADKQAIKAEAAAIVDRELWEAMTCDGRSGVLDRAHDRVYGVALGDLKAAGQWHELEAEAKILADYMTKGREHRNRREVLPITTESALEEAVGSGYAQALKNVREYKWPHRGGPTEDVFGDFYAAMEDRTTPARCTPNSSDGPDDELPEESAKG